jgi:YHS domain-containing protein
MAPTTMATDLVCGMTVHPATARRTSEYQGTSFYFCSPGCKKAFDADPTSYVGKTESASTPKTAGGCACCEASA